MKQAEITVKECFSPKFAVYLVKSSYSFVCLQFSQRILGNLFVIVALLFLLLPLCRRYYYYVVVLLFSVPNSLLRRPSVGRLFKKMKDGIETCSLKWLHRRKLETYRGLT